MAKKRGEVKKKPLDVNERAQLEELKEENRRLKMEWEVLKKRYFFANSTCIFNSAFSARSRSRSHALW